MAAADSSATAAAAVALAVSLASAAPAFGPAVPSRTPTATRTSVGHGLSIVMPAHWRVTHRHFTPCSDPTERFSLLSGREVVLMVQERHSPARAELTPRPRHFAVHGRPAPLECCSLPGRAGWVLHFDDHGRAFYAYLYPGSATPGALLRTLDSFRAVPANPL
jgi:hypothetical protein